MERSGGLQSWNVRALPIPSVLTSARGADRLECVRAQPATGLEVRGGGRTTLLERGMMAVSKKKGQV